ncbi:MAG: PEP-CTERM sorting domain-containing protein [Symploca sp. SIO2E9]|nr:PEP-CTERM sorting domain-containing protein [Symploca sp. SIO2E9]
MSITKIINGSTITASAASLIGVAALLGANPAQASGFSGSYNPSNWDFSNLNADGFVDTTNAPSSITLTGGNNGSGFSGQTSYTTTSLANGLVSFNWNYITTDVDGPFWDPFGFIVNGNFTLLSKDNGGFLQSNIFSTTVNKGDIFGFAIDTVDNIFGAASVTISDFNAPEAESVPEPASLLGLLTVGALGAGSVLKRKKQQA